MDLHTPKPIAEQIPFNVTDAKKRPNTMYVVIGGLACALLAILGFYGIKLILESVAANKRMSRMAPTGFLQANQSFMNANSRLFKDHPSNFAVTLSMDAEPRTVWNTEIERVCAAGRVHPTIDRVSRRRRSPRKRSILMHFFSCILIYLFVLSVINPATQRPSESSLTCLTPPASLGIATQL